MPATCSTSRTTGTRTASPGFAEATWTRTIHRAVDLSTRLADGRALRPGDVEIMHGANGNVSLEVAYPGVTILFSMPNDQDAPIRYFGRSDDAERTTKGLLVLQESLDWLSDW